MNAAFPQRAFEESAQTDGAAVTPDVGQRPDLQLVPPILAPWQEERERALEFARTPDEELGTGTAIDPATLSKGAIATAIVALGKERRREEPKPSDNETDSDKTPSLLAQSDRLMALLPDWSLRTTVVFLAHDL